MRPISPVVPRKGIERWLYETLRHLEAGVTQASSGLNAVARGEVPDGSGLPLVDLSKYFYLPGRVGGQVGYGSTQPAGTLTLSSTANASKGLIYFGSTQTQAAFDEVNTFWGIGNVAPAARLHLTNPTSGVAIVGNAGTSFIRGTLTAATMFDIAPILIPGSVFDVGIIGTNAGLQFQDNGVTTAGLRFAFSGTRTFIQGGRWNSGGTAVNRNMTFGGTGATVGASIIHNFQFTAHTTSVGSTEAAVTIPANAAFVAINQDPVDYASSALANRPALLVTSSMDNAGTPAPTNVPLAISITSTTLNRFEVRKQYTGASPSKTLGNLMFALQPGLSSLNGETAIVGYVSNTETMRLQPISGSLLQWAFQSPAGLNQFEHAVTTGLWGDSLAGNSNRIALGDVASTVRAVALTSSGGAVFDRFGITTQGMTIENTTLGGAAAAISVPTGILSVINNATNGNNAKVLLYLNTKRTTQTADIMQAVSSVSGAATFSVNNKGMLIATILSSGFFADVTDPTKKVALALAGLTTATTRTITVPDASGTLALIDVAQIITGAWSFQGSGVAAPEIFVNSGGVAYSGTGFVLWDGNFRAEIQGPTGAGFTANRVIAMPDGSGTMVLSGVVTQIVGNTSSTLTTVSSSIGASFMDNSTNSKRLRFVLSGAAGNNSITLTNTVARNYGLGDLGGNIAVVGDQAPAVSAGRLGKVDLTAQTANIATTNLSNTPPAGMYMVDVYLLCTTADATAGTLTVTIGWTDAVGATTDTTVTLALTATGRAKALIPIQVASGNITYAVANGGIYGTSQYAIYVRVVSLG